jgi:hypothetical protein
MKTLLSVFGGGLWFIPLALTVSALYSFYRGYKQSKSGSLESIGGRPTPSNTNVPFWKCPATIFGYIFTLATIAVIILMYQDK